VHIDAKTWCGVHDATLRCGGVLAMHAGQMISIKVLSLEPTYVCSCLCSCDRPVDNGPTTQRSGISRRLELSSQSGVKVPFLMQMHIGSY